MFDRTAALQADRRAEPGAPGLPGVCTGSLGHWAPSWRSAPAGVQAGLRGYPAVSCKELGDAGEPLRGLAKQTSYCETFFVTYPLKKSAF